MATVIIPLRLKDADATPGAAFPTPVLAYASGGGTLANQFPIQVAVFPDSIVSGAVWAFDPNVVGTPATTLIIDWFSPTTITGSVVWNCNVATAGAVGSTLLTRALSTVNTASTPVSGTLAGRVRTSLSLANADGFASTSPSIFVKVTRDGTSASDTAVGDVWVFGMCVSYSDT